MATYCESVPDLRIQGRDTFQSLLHRCPVAFSRALGFRSALRLLTRSPGAIPTAAPGPWRLDDVSEEGNRMEIRYRIEEGWVDYYLGFVEALLEHFGECAFILVQTLQQEVRFQVTLAH